MQDFWRYSKFQVPRVLSSKFQSPSSVLFEFLHNCQTLFLPTMNTPSLFQQSEGLNLSREGKLCVIQVATPKHVFVIDVCAFPADDPDLRGALKSGLEFLQDPTILKVMFDPRTDSDALYHQIGVTLNAVLDVQLAKIWYSKTCARPRYVHRFRLLCISSAHAKRWGHQMWAKRPLPKHMVTYAAQDVLGSFEVAGILARGLLEHPSQLEAWSAKLWRASQTAVSVFRDAVLMAAPSKALTRLPDI